MNTLLVDGYNIIHALPEFRKLLDSKLSDARAALIHSLGRLAAAKKGNVTIHVFFDAKKTPDFLGDSEPHLAGVEVHFSEGQNADEAMLDFLHRFPNLAEVTVVTNDVGLARRARDEGAMTLSSAGLAHRLAKINP